jgi:hypothetical protein
VSEVLNGEKLLFWDTMKPKPTKYSKKVVGLEFEKRVIDSDQDVLLLIYHPLSQKNRGLKQKFESFAETHAQVDLLIGRYNGINESAVYKNPQKLPALVYFRRQPDGSFKEVIEFDRTRELMLRSSTNAKFD